MTAKDRRDSFDGADVDALWDRALSRVEVTPSGCWHWPGAVNSRGYASISTGTGRTGSVHRLAVIVRDGAIGEGMQIDHTCHDSRCQARPCPHRRCVNPDHLAQVTPGENVRRKHEDARCRYGHPLTTRPDGARRCATCAGAYDANYRTSQPSVSGLTAAPAPYDAPLPLDWPEP